VGTLEIDESRSRARFVVTEAKMACPRAGEASEGGYGIGWLVRARRLQDESSPYHDQGLEEIEFRMSGPFKVVIMHDDIIVVGTRNPVIHD